MLESVCKITFHVFNGSLHDSNAFKTVFINPSEWLSFNTQVVTAAETIKLFWLVLKLTEVGKECSQTTHNDFTFGNW